MLQLQKVCGSFKFNPHLFINPHKMVFLLSTATGDSSWSIISTMEWSLSVTWWPPKAFHASNIFALAATFLWTFRAKYFFFSFLYLEISSALLLTHYSFIYSFRQSFLSNFCYLEIFWNAEDPDQSAIYRDAILKLIKMSVHGALLYI